MDPEFIAGCLIAGLIVAFALFLIHLQQEARHSRKHPHVSKLASFHDWERTRIQMEKNIELAQKARANGN